jgi:hypothetical protein
MPSPARWKTDAASGDYIWEQTGHSGHRCLRVNRSAGPWHGFFSPSIPVKPNTRYYLSFWGKYNGTGANGARAVVVDQNSGRCYDTSVCQTHATDWAPAISTFTTWSAATTIRIRLELNGLDTDGDIWFDDLRLEEME